MFLRCPSSPQQHPPWTGGHISLPDRHVAIKAESQALCLPYVLQQLVETPRVSSFAEVAERTWSKSYCEHFDLTLAPATTS